MKTSKATATKKTASRPKKLTKATGNGKVASKPNQAESAVIASDSDASEIDRLGTMSVGDLQGLYAQVIGQPTRCPRRGWLVQKIMEAAVPAEMGASGDIEAPAIETKAGDATLAATSATQCVAETEPSGALEEALVNAAPAAAPDLAEVPDIDCTGAIASEDKLSQLDVPALQARYLKAFGRATTSSSRTYLVGRLRDALKGRVSGGPRIRHQKTGDDLMVLPLRMEANLVDELDSAWRRQGLRSRMDLFRRSLASYLAGIGETDVAALLASEA